MEMPTRYKPSGIIPHIWKGRSNADDLLLIKLPPVKPNVVVPVIELFLK